MPIGCLNSSTKGRKTLQVLILFPGEENLTSYLKRTTFLLSETQSQDNENWALDTESLGSGFFYKKKQQIPFSNKAMTELNEIY